MALHPLVAVHLDEIRAISAQFGIEKLEVFGSAMTPEFDPARSDVDFIVHYPEGYDFGPFVKNLFDFEDALGAVLGRPAQVVMTKALTNPRFRESADQTRWVIYETERPTELARGDTDILSVHR